MLQAVRSARAQVGMPEQLRNNEDGKERKERTEGETDIKDGTYDRVELVEDVVHTHTRGQHRHAVCGVCWVGAVAAMTIKKQARTNQM